jgi:phage terminase small subunit
MPLKPRHSAFVDQYLVDFSGTQAAIRAGYSAKTAAQIGSRLLRNASIATEIERRREKSAAKVGLTRERVLRETELIAHSNLTDFLVDSATGNVTLREGAPADAWKAVASISRTPGMFGVAVKIQLWPKGEMVKMAGKHLNVEGFGDRVEHTGKDGGPIQYEGMTTEQKQARLLELAAAAEARTKEG